jgi:PAS domain-containing protein
MNVEGVAMIDARRPAWEMVYTNTRFSATCGEPVEDLVGKGFWHLFKPIDGVS